MGVDVGINFFVEASGSIYVPGFVGFRSMINLDYIDYAVDCYLILGH